MSPRRAAAFVMAEAERGSDSARLDAARVAFVASEARVKETRTAAAALVKQVTGDSKYNDVNYVFPTFVTTRLPVGLVHDHADQITLDPDTGVRQAVQLVFDTFTSTGSARAVVKAFTAAGSAKSMERPPCFARRRKGPSPGLTFTRRGKS